MINSITFSLIFHIRNQAKKKSTEKYHYLDTFDPKFYAERQKLDENEITFSVILVECNYSVRI